MKFYYLENKEIKSTEDPMEYFIKMGIPSKNPNRVAQTFIGDTEVSTVFLMGGVTYPFETMTFGSKTHFVDRYKTYEEAEKGHQEACEMISAGMN